MGAGLAATAQGGWRGFAGTCSSGGGPGPLTPQEQWPVPLPLLASAQGTQMHLFNSRGHQGCQDHKCQI